MIVLNRKQNDMKLLFFDVKTGGSRQVMDETSPTWIDVYDFYAGVQDLMTFPENKREFFWVSDRDGYQHIYRYDYSGKLIQQVTHGKWSVTRIEGTDPAKQTDLLHVDESVAARAAALAGEVRRHGPQANHDDARPAHDQHVAERAVLHRHAGRRRRSRGRSSCGRRRAASCARWSATRRRPQWLASHAY